MLCEIDAYLDVLDDVKVQHRSQPEVVYISQCTEVGTVYRPQEVTELCQWAHANNLRVVMDGARIANAVATLNCSIIDVTVNAGVDVLVFGGTKNGLVFGEAVIFFDRSLAVDFQYTRKNCGMFDIYNICIYVYV
jgi:threonine aldolase